MSSSVSVTALDLPRGFPSVCVFHTITRNFSKPLSASCFDSLTSSSSRDFSTSCTIQSTSVHTLQSSNLLDLVTTPFCLASSRALVRGMALCLLHSEAPTLGLLHVLFALDPVDSRRLLRLCHPVSHGPDSSWDLSSRAPPDSTKRARSTRSIWSWLAFITNALNSSKVLQCGHFSSYARCSSRKTLFSCLQLGSFALRRERVLGPSDVSLSSNNKTSSPRPQHEVVLVLHSSLH